MIIERTMHEQFLSNTYLVADHKGGTAVFIDAGAPIQPLMQLVDELDLRVTHVLLTHEHHDHTIHSVALRERYGATIVTPEALLEKGELTTGDLHIRATSTPGHCDVHAVLVVNDEACFTGDVLFEGTVGGTVDGGEHGFDRIKSSVMDSIMSLPDEVALYPGHSGSTTVGRERTENPFVRAWSSDQAPEGEPVQVAGTPATLVLEGPDYDGGTKAWIQFENGNEAIVGGSMVTRPSGVS